MDPPSPTDFFPLWKEEATCGAQRLPVGSRRLRPTGLTLGWRLPGRGRDHKCLSCKWDMHRQCVRKFQWKMKPIKSHSTYKHDENVLHPTIILLSFVYWFNCFMKTCYNQLFKQPKEQRRITFQLFPKYTEIRTLEFMSAAGQAVSVMDTEICALFSTQKINRRILTKLSINVSCANKVSHYEIKLMLTIHFLFFPKGYFKPLRVQNAMPL